MRADNNKKNDGDAEKNPFARGTRAYEKWLGARIVLDQEELKKKHKKIQKDAFEFLRATFYRWAELWQKNSEEMGLHRAPEVLGVGDLHVENFGTWRDADGRLAWGINDFDEACPLPYVNDLVRLATSTVLAVESENNAACFEKSVTAEAACAAILDGYARGMKQGLKRPDKRRPYVLAEKHAWLRTVAANKLEKKDENGQTKFEKLVEELTGKLGSLTFPVPPGAREALLRSFPRPIPGYPEYRIGQREAGLGSLGRQRFTAVIDDWYGGLIAREAKALAPSAWLWAAGREDARDLWYETILTGAVRAPDPWIRVHEGWVVRRLAPDAGKVKLDDLPPELDRALLCAMGAETANVHSWSHQPLEAVVADLESRGQDPEWFLKAVERMKGLTLKDWKDCKDARL